MQFLIQIKLDSGETYDVTAESCAVAWRVEKVVRQEAAGYNDIVSVTTLEVVK